VEIPASYTSAAAGSVAREEQEYVRELMRRLGYDLEHNSVAGENPPADKAGPDEERLPTSPR
jgi:hypothetical protein